MKQEPLICKNKIKHQNKHGSLIKDIYERIHKH